MFVIAESNSVPLLELGIVQSLAVDANDLLCSKLIGVEVRRSIKLIFSEKSNKSVVFTECCNIQFKAKLSVLFNSSAEIQECFSVVHVILDLCPEL